MRQVLVKIYWILNSQFGLDPLKAIRSIRGVPRYIRDYFHFRRLYTGRFEFRPCLHDWYEEGGSTRSEYFWQDLLVARMISEAKPTKHVDIGSRVDGFVAHVASFRDIEVFDVRPITTKIPGVIFRAADLMNPVEETSNYCDSLSCLHALEHFGLGRYCDPIDPEGYKHGLANMAGLLCEGGTFYLSVPIGIDRVEFNAHRVFDPRIIVELAKMNSLKLIGLTLVRRGCVENSGLSETELSELANQRYALGIFTFIKHKEM